MPQLQPSSPNTITTKQQPQNNVRNVLWNLSGELGLSCLIEVGDIFFHGGDRRNRPDEQLGGVGGGMKFVWRGILFKLADGSSGPYLGNDEAAAKGSRRFFGTILRYSDPVPLAPAAHLPAAGAGWADASAFC